MEVRSLLTLVVATLYLSILPGATAVDQLFIFVNGEYNPSGTCVREGQGSSVTLLCKYLASSQDTPRLFELNLQHQSMELPTTHDQYHGSDVLSYTIPSENRNGQHSYKCQDSTDSVYVSISFGGAPCLGTPTPPPPATHPPSKPATLPQTPPPPVSPSNSGGQDSPKFTGLNPLIYTISAVILLGTLAIVSIITCWIRARRSFNNRVLRANNTPQDYLDYIGDSEFTPLTTSEFVASLQERPPTYHESEQIEQDTRSGADENATSSETATTDTTNTTTTTTSSTSPPPPPPPPPRSRPLPALPTLSPHLLHRVTLAPPPSAGHEASTESGSETVAGAQLTQSVSTSGVTRPAASADNVVVGTLVNVDVSSETNSAPPPSVMTSRSAPTMMTSTTRDMLSLTPEQIDEIEAAVGAVNVHMGHTHEQQRTE